jgi:ell wall binding domain 2 (CWB2)/Bacterial Ig-like domain (group 3)
LYSGCRSFTQTVTEFLHAVGLNSPILSRRTVNGGDFSMKLARPVILLATIALAVAVPLGAGAAASSSGVQPTTGSVAGVIDNSVGAPLAGVCVTVWDTSLNGVGEAQSGFTGAYTIANIQPGVYTVTIDGCGGYGHPNVQAQAYDNTQSSVHTPVAVVAGQTSQLNPQRMQPGGEITIDVTDSHGAAIPHLSVTIVPVFGQAPAFLMTAGRPYTNPDAGNVWHFVDLLPIDYDIVYASCPPGALSCVYVGSYRGQSWSSTTSTPVLSVPGTTVALVDTLTVPPVSVTTTTATASPNIATLGEPITLSATVTASDGSIPTGSVDFATSLNQFGQAQLGPNGTASVTALAVPIGTWNVYATYHPLGLYTSSMSPVALTIEPATGGGGGGSTGGGGGAAAAVPVTVTVPTGGSASSDPAGTTPDASNPLVVGLTSPTGGTVTIDKTPPDTAVAHYTVLGVGATITAPPATTANPLTLTFHIFDKQLPTGSQPSDLTIFRDGVAVVACTGAGATPDPCVASAVTGGGVSTIVIRSSDASTWDVEAAHVGREAGADRLATAVAVSEDSFPGGNAGAVVLARADDYPDALVGGPLAASKNAPLLLTQGSTLPATTATELRRVLPSGRTVCILGGTSAVPASVATQLASLGYVVVRYSGADRYATAVAVAAALGSPTTVLLATGTNFPDALAAGPAAAHVHGAILLTSGSSLPAETAAYLTGAPTVYAIGGPAAAAVPSATAVVGTDRFATAAAVATRFFPSSTVVGVATGTGFPDALAGGAQLALTGAPLLLSSSAGLPAATTAYLTADHPTLTNVYVYGGTAVLGTIVANQLTASLGS